jgi:hypothetical protein
MKTDEANPLDWMEAGKAAQRDTRFVHFAKVAQSLTEQFWEQHYPGGDLSEVGSDYEEQHLALVEMTRLIEHELGQGAIKS